ncbi:hypothetical protein ACWDT6_21990 [Nocardia grenadensis]|uniref:hypothetical protein n=1 Tax=Nocardia grenadensis TaxID=931537 RepID=UPI003D73869E
MTVDAVARMKAEASAEQSMATESGKTGELWTIERSRGPARILISPGRISAIERPLAALCHEQGESFGRIGGANVRHICHLRGSEGTITG